MSKKRSDICGAKLPDGTICMKPKVARGRCAQHGAYSTGAKTQEGKLRQIRLKTGIKYSFLLKCAICPPSLQCEFYDKNREYCPLEESILLEEINVQAIREQRIKRNLITLERCERVFLKKGDTNILTHIERLDSQLEKYLNAYEKLAPKKKAKTFVELLSEKRKQLMKDLINITLAGEKFGKGFIRGEYWRLSQRINVYVDQIAQFVYLVYPRRLCFDALIRLITIVVLHEYTHHATRIITSNEKHRRWNTFLLNTLWEYLK